MRPLIQLISNDSVACPFTDTDGTCNLEISECVGLDNEKCPLESHIGVWVQKAEDKGK